MTLQTTENKNEVKITYKDEEVIYNTRNETWKFAGIEQDVVKRLNPEVWKEITSLLEKEVAEYQDKLKREEEELKAKTKAENARKTEAFRQQITPIIPTGFELSVNSPNSFSIKKDGVSAGISFDDRIYRGSSYHSSKTTMPWLVNFNYRNQRTSTEQSAIKSAVKKITGELETRENKRKAEEERNNVTGNLTELLKQHGIELKEETVWDRHGYGNRNRNSYKVRKASIITAGDNKEYGEKIGIRGNVIDQEGNINSVYVIGKFTPEQFKKLADFVAGMDVKKTFTS